MAQKSCKRLWRKLVKKFQRKRRRQKLAHQRGLEMEKIELEKLKDPRYKKWLEQQETIKRQNELFEENNRLEQEQLWLRREKLAQKQFERDRLKAQAEEAKLEAERLKEGEKLKLIEEARQRKIEEINIQKEKAAKEFDNIMNCMQEYLEDGSLRTPTRLEHIVETRPGEKSCDFFDKTNCCRFEPRCTFNHKKPMLSKIIIIKHFFHHPLLEQKKHDEYSISDSELELNERDLRDSYDDFCEDVWPVLLQFGKIVNFRTVRNIQAHLRGHVFVEYAEKRSALKAFINLQSRYYASKRLSVEFSNIRSWRTAVCGMRSLKGPALGRKCPKGVTCNFLHLMKNIDNKFNTPVNNPERYPCSTSKCDKTVPKSPITNWNSDKVFESKSLQSQNWRWSESPETELKAKNSEEKREIKSNTTKKNSSISPPMEFSHKKLNSNSPGLNIIKICRNSDSKSSCSSCYHKNEEKFSRAKEKKDSESKSKAEIKTTERQKSNSSKSKRRKSSHRRSKSSKRSRHESESRSRRKSSLKAEKDKCNKKASNKHKK